jgi:hypothetical protein
MTKPNTDGEAMCCTSPVTDTADARSRNFYTRRRAQKSNSIPRILHSQEMLVSQNESAIEKVE